MKKIYLLTSIILSCILFVGCAGDTTTEPKITMSLEKSSPFGGTLLIEYQAGDEVADLSYGSEFMLEVQEDDKWIKMEYVDEDVMFPLGLSFIQDGGKAEEKLNWGLLYGELQPGHYRISIEFTLAEEVRTESVEFDIE